MSTNDQNNASLPPPVGWQAPLLDLLLVVARRKSLIAGVVILGLAAGVAQFVRTPKFYRASALAVLLPREKPLIDASYNSGSMETSEANAARAPAAPLMLPPNRDLYIGLLTSRPVLERLASDFTGRLPTVSAAERSDENVRAVADMIAIKGTEDGLLTITVTGPSPQLSAEVANKLLEYGQEASKEIERGMILQQAGFLDKALARARADAQAAESVLNEFTARHRLVDPTNESADALRRVRDAIDSRDQTRVLLEQRLLHFTEADPEVRRLRATIEQRNKQVAEARTAMAGDTGASDYGKLVNEYDGLKQRVRFCRELAATLTAQASLFRIRAEQPAGSMAVVRQAVPVAEPAGPSKKNVLGVALGAAIFGAMAFALLLEQWSAVHATPELRRKWELVRAAATRSNNRAARDPGRRAA